MHTPQDNRRVVPKVRYIGIMGKRFTARLLYLCCVFAGIGGIGATIALMCVALASRTPWYFEILLLPVATLFGFLFMAGREGLNAADQEENIVPLTRQTLREMPDDQSLVRASAVETATPESVLLRPAQAQSETVSKELLRPHNGE